MDVEVRLIDFDRVMNLIHSFENVDKDKAIRTGLKDAGNVFLNAGKENLSQRTKIKTGNLASSFRLKLKREKLGVLVGFNSYGSHAHLIDRGTVERTTNSGANRGKIIGNRFFDDAIADNENTAINKVYSGIERYLNNTIK